ncbi:TatD family deoxyribonuclease [Thiocapsa imhoffii]|uniref:TatD family deoxyribonuclease n=1 Tax=Thiocapsa imhoffii TaxID=382777 RepID=A0A9X0WIR8_9GAMM|nr:TatD family hydrolase [Thiocapsa imhoffii]MBK1645300.1 TatD family deoxyribonuclease [Thiocapsa imhoffii]
MLVDSHCHLDRVDLSHHGGNFSRMMAASADAGVGHMLCVSIDLESYPSMRRLVDPYPQVDVSVGVHPNQAEGDEPSVAHLVALADDPRVVAIGETGLDYYRRAGSSPEDGDEAEDWAWQRERFRCHVQAARHCGKPLIIHTRAAREDTVRVLREEGADAVGGVLHCFTETWEMAKAGLDLGFYVSFSGIITFKNAADLRAVARRVPDDRLLIETDSPYLAPVPHRGKPNEPRRLTHVAECLAELRGRSVPDLAALTGENYQRLFRRRLSSPSDTNLVAPAPGLRSM